MQTPKFVNLLVPFDFGGSHLNTFKVAEDIAIRSGACITLLHLLTPVLMVSGEHAGRFSMASVPNMPMHAEREKLIREFANKSPLPESRINIIVRTGDLTRNIIELNKVNTYDLILVPDFQRTIWDRLLADINPLQIMEKTKVPIISVNKEVDKFKINKIVLPVRDVANWFDKIPFIIALAKMSGAKICVLGLASSDTETKLASIKQKLAECYSYLKLNYFNFTIEKIRVNKDLDAETLDFADSEKADLIALTPPRNFFKLKSYFNSYFYTKIISRGHVPVLALTTRV